MEIADSAEDFAARVVELYTDPVRWTLLREAALERVSKECSRETFVERARELLDNKRSVSQWRASAV
jgi:hypothetical protein